jgi:trehalose/maltose hydrolase-like predicted phosphorylase
MTSHIFSKLTQISLVALVSLPLGVAFKVEPVSAKSNITQNTEHNLPAKNIIAKVELDGSAPAASDSRAESMSLVKQGLAAQEAGNEEQAMLYFYEAVTIDITNPYAFLAAGNLLGNTQEGINCIRAAAVLFQAEENQAGFRLATNWLAERGISE